MWILYHFIMCHSVWTGQWRLLDLIMNELWYLVYCTQHQSKCLCSLRRRSKRQSRALDVKEAAQHRRILQSSQPKGFAEHANRIAAFLNTAPKPGEASKRSAPLPVSVQEFYSIFNLFDFNTASRAVIIKATQWKCKILLAICRARRFDFAVRGAGLILIFCRLKVTLVYDLFLSCSASTPDWMWCSALRSSDKASEPTASIENDRAMLSKEQGSSHKNVRPYYFAKQARHSSLSHPPAANSERDLDSFTIWTMRVSSLYIPPSLDRISLAVNSRHSEKSS